MIFEDSAALLGIVIAAVGLLLTDYQVGGAVGAYWDGLASILIGLVLAVVAFVLARASRGLLLGEAASSKTIAAIKQAIESHPNVDRVVELLTMHLAPKQILINAHVKMRQGLMLDEVERTVLEVEDKIKQVEPKVEMIFLEAARDQTPATREPLAQNAR